MAEVLKCGLNISRCVLQKELSAMNVILTI